ncbi:MAG: glycerol-3-phosphate acyltransferase [Clostridia bacterium]|nr:glycerol-3-phosphate acyltransferase [Clostridia bacterium]
MLQLLVILLAYGLGCSNMALYLSKWNKVDLRAGGSGNLGASNATLLLGWKAGVLTAVHDTGKALLAVLLAQLLCPGSELMAAAAGIACVLGHIYPAPMKFRGGKGFAPYVGMTLALHWKFALVVLGVILLVTLLTDYIVVGTTTTVLMVPSYLGWTRQNLWLACILLIGTIVIICKHRENYIRIWNGTEFRTTAAFRRK